MCKKGILEKHNHHRFRGHIANYFHVSFNYLTEYILGSSWQIYLYIAVADADEEVEERDRQL